MSHHPDHDPRFKPRSKVTGGQICPSTYLWILRCTLHALVLQIGRVFSAQVAWLMLMRADHLRGAPGSQLGLLSLPSLAGLLTSSFLFASLSAHSAAILPKYFSAILNALYYLLLSSAIPLIICSQHAFLYTHHQPSNSACGHRLKDPSTTHMLPSDPLHGVNVRRKLLEFERLFLVSLLWHAPLTLKPSSEYSHLHALRVQLQPCHTPGVSPLLLVPRN